MTIPELSAFFRAMYARSNAIYFNGLSDRVTFFMWAVGDLEDAVRKQRDEAVVQHALARVCSLVFGVAWHFADLPLIQALSSKFPQNGCAYCRHRPCVCVEQRADPLLTPPNAEQCAWTLRQWQEHLDQLYGAANRGRGVSSVFERLFKEICEILELQSGVAYIDAGVDELEWQYALEVSDVLSWVIAVANVLNVDLAEAVEKTYADGCPACCSRVCQCRRYLVEAGMLKRFASSLALVQRQVAMFQWSP